MYRVLVECRVRATLTGIGFRWDVDDPVGRFIKRFPEAKVLRYPAIAEKDEKNRLKGEALFPEHKRFSCLMERKKLMTQAGWGSGYQQNPIVVGGGAISDEKARGLPQFDTRRIK